MSSWRLKPSMPKWSQIVFNLAAAWARCSSLNLGGGVWSLQGFDFRGTPLVCNENRNLSSEWLRVTASIYICRSKCCSHINRKQLELQQNSPSCWLLGQVLVVENIACEWYRLIGNKGVVRTCIGLERCSAWWARPLAKAFKYSVIHTCPDTVPYSFDILTACLSL